MNSGIFIRLSLFLTTLLAWLPTQAYIGEVSVWENDQEVIVYTASDGHNLGTKEENRKQLKFFEDHFFKCYKEGKNILQILVENEGLWGLSLENSKLREKIFSGPFESSLDTDHGGKLLLQLESHDEQSTWISDDFLRSSISFQNVSIKSIDPRLIAEGLDKGSLRHLFEDPILSEIDLYLEDEKNKNSSDPWLTEIIKFYKEIRGYQQQVVEIFYGSGYGEKIYWKVLDAAKRHARNGSLKVLLPQLDDETSLKLSTHWLSRLDKLRRSDQFLLEGPELMALWQIKNAKPKDHLLLLAGGEHINNIKISLEKVGFKKVFETAPFWEVLKDPKPIDESVELAKIPEGLDAAIKLGVLFMSIHTDCGTSLNLLGT